MLQREEVYIVIPEHVMLQNFKITNSPHGKLVENCMPRS
jgi:hypothetical protein